MYASLVGLGMSSWEHEYRHHQKLKTLQTIASSTCILFTSLCQLHCVII